MVTSTADIETLLGRPLTDAETEVLQIAGPAIEADYADVVGPLTRSVRTITMQPMGRVHTVHVPGPLHDVLSVTIDGIPFALCDTLWWRNGTIRMRCLSEWDLLEIEIDHGWDPLPAQLSAEIASRIATAVRARSIGEAIVATVGRNVTGHSIGATNVTYAAPTETTMHAAVTGGASWWALTPAERRALRTRWGRAAATTVRH